MNNLLQSLIHINDLDDLANQDSYIHHYHPLLKMIITLIMLVLIISSNSLLELVSYFILIILLGIIAKIPLIRLIKRGLLGLPFSLCIGISNLLLNHTMMNLYGIMITEGCYSCILILLKTFLCLSITYILIATTSFSDLASSLVKVKVPSIFVLQLMMTYRYIFTFLEETKTMYDAYILRNPNVKGIAMKDMGSFVGHLLVKSMIQSKRVYLCMLCRGFNVKKVYAHCKSIEIEQIYPMLMFGSILVIIKELL